MAAKDCRSEKLKGREQPDCAYDFRVGGQDTNFPAGFFCLSFHDLRSKEKRRMYRTNGGTGLKKNRTICTYKHSCLYFNVRGKFVPRDSLIRVISLIRTISPFSALIRVIL